MSRLTLTHHTGHHLAANMYARQFPKAPPCTTLASFCILMRAGAKQTLHHKQSTSTSSVGTDDPCRRRLGHAHARIALPSLPYGYGGPARELRAIVPSYNTTAHKGGTSLITTLNARLSPRTTLSCPESLYYTISLPTTLIVHSRRTVRPSTCRDRRTIYPIRGSLPTMCGEQGWVLLHFLLIGG